MAILQTYDLNGKKLSFANWISNLSPIETPFVSMTGKEAVNQTKFYWQTDRLTPAVMPNVIEGSDAVESATTSTVVNDNVTQILRKVIKVSDTVNSLANYGRGRELAYQMEKSGKALKRDLEVILLSDQAKVEGNASTARKTAGFRSLVATKGTADSDTGAVVHFDAAGKDAFVEADLYSMFYNLYLSGSKADTIMFHPQFASFFAKLVEHGADDSRMKVFYGPDEKFVHYVNTIVDQLGTQWKLVPNRFMPVDALYFYTPADWTQMVLRAPSRTELAKDGSYEMWMMEMEIGLRHRDPFASGVLTLKK